MSLLEDDLGAPDIGRQALEGLLHDELDTHGGGQVEHCVTPAHHVVDQVGIEDRAEDELEVTPPEQVLDVGPLEAPLPGADGAGATATHAIPNGR